MPADGNTNKQSPDYVRKNLRIIIDDLAARGGAVIIERYREPKAVIINYEDYLSVAPLLHREPAPAQ